MTIEKIMTNLFGFSAPTYYKWSKSQREERPIFELLEKYFTKNELEEFINTGKIFRFDRASLTSNFEYELFTKLLDNTLFDLTTTEFIRYMIEEFKESSSPKIFKNDFIFFLSKNFENLIKEINEDRLSSEGEIINEDDYNSIFSSILDVLNELSEREFRHIVNSSSFYNPFNDNYTDNMR